MSIPRELMISYKKIKITKCVLMSKKLKDVIDVSGVFLGIGLLTIIGSVIRFIFTSNIINVYIISIGIILLIIGLLIRKIEK
jgi:uncharacterized membrane protein YgdD (TMEM256/DUF423 family)